MAQHDVRVVATLSGSEAGPGHVETYRHGYELTPWGILLRDSGTDDFPSAHPLLAAEIAQCVELGQFFETATEWRYVFEDRLFRDFLPYSGD